MEKIVKKLANLIDVKSIITISFTICFVVMAIQGVIGGGDFLTTFLIILTYYFTKKEDQKTDDKIN